MADKPILFSGPMVRALLAGTKTQTRRALNPQPNMLNGGKPLNDGRGSYSTEDGWKKLRYAKGDRLYVREHWRTGGQHDHIAPRDLPQEWAEPIGYIADEAPNTISRTGRFRQGMHMPRWASRLTLTVTNVRVERLQDISERDALAEGVAPLAVQSGACKFGVDLPNGEVGAGVTAVDAYCVLWSALHGDLDALVGEGSWYSNPWVATYTFSVDHGNIDALAKAA